MRVHVATMLSSSCFSLGPSPVPALLGSPNVGEQGAYGGARVFVRVCGGVFCVSSFLV